MAKIVRYKLRNIQSWDDKSEWVYLDQEYLNIIIGRNETGKSVLFKVLAQMFIPSQFGSSRRDLVKDGCSTGTAAFELNTGVIVVFQIGINNQQSYLLIYPDGKRLQSTGDTPPPELAKEFGWYVDSAESIILNLLHRDSNLPFVNTTLGFNANLLHFLNEDPEIEDIRQTIEGLLAELKTGMDVSSQKISTLLYRYDSIEDVNVTSKKKALESALELLEIWPLSDNLQSTILKMYQLPVVPEPFLTLEDNSSFIDSLPVFSELTIKSDELFQALDSIPESKDYSFLPALEELAALDGLLQELIRWSKELQCVVNIESEKDYSFLPQLEEAVSANSSINELIARVDVLMRALIEVGKQSAFGYLDSLGEAVEINGLLCEVIRGSTRLVQNISAIPPAREYHLELAEEVVATSKLIMGLKIESAKILSAHIEYKNSEIRLAHINSDITELQQQLRVCPTCGRKF